MSNKKRCGTVLVFKPEVSKAEAEEALEVLSGLLAEDYWLDENGFDHVDFVVHEFDAENGGPCWYLP